MFNDLRNSLFQILGGKPGYVRLLSKPGLLPFREATGGFDRLADRMLELAADPALVERLGAAWIALVALMAQLGFSGEWRYAVPGAAAIAIAGGAGLAARPRAPAWTARRSTLATS